MRVVYLCDDFPPEAKGGAGSIAYQIACGVAGKGYDVQVITTTRDKKKIGWEAITGFPVFRIYSDYQNGRFFSRRGWLGVKNRKALKHLEIVLKQRRPEIIHAHHLQNHLSFAALKVAKKYARKVFITIHDVGPIAYAKFTNKAKLENNNFTVSLLEKLRQARLGFNPWREIMIRRYLSLADKIFTVSDALKEVLEQNGIKNIETIHNGININAADFLVAPDRVRDFKNHFRLEGKTVLLFIYGASAGTYKGGGEILSALARFKVQSSKSKIKDWVLLAVGYKEGYGEKFIKIAEGLGLEDRVILTDWLESSEMKLAYLASDIYINPSIAFDSFPTTNLEAMAAKLPIIGTIFGGTKEVIIENGNGFLVNPYDTETMAQRIKYLLENPEEAKEMGEDGYNIVSRKFSLKSQVDELLGWYGKIKSPGGD